MDETEKAFIMASADILSQRRKEEKDKLNKISKRR